VGKPQETRYVKVARAGGVDVDLVIKVAAGSHYDRTFNQETKGIGAGVVADCLGWIPLKTNTETKFQFSFVKTGTSVVHKVSKFNLAILDLDIEGGFSPNEKEYIVLDTAVSQLTRGSKIARVGDNNGAMRMESTVNGNAGDNPTLPLNSLHRQKTFEVTYTDVGVWEVTIGHEHGNPEKDRQFYFYGQTENCPPTPAPTPVPTPLPTPVPTPSPTGVPQPVFSLDVFNGQGRSGDMLRFPHKAEYDRPSDSLTIVGWVKTRTTGYHTLISRGEWTEGYSLMVLSHDIDSARAGRARGGVNIDSTSAPAWGDFVTTTTIAPGTWYHLALKMEAGVIKLFVNGVEESSKSLGQKSIAYTSTDLWVGGEALGLGNKHTERSPRHFMDGEIASLQVWDLALPDDEIRKISTMTALGWLGCTSGKKCSTCEGDCDYDHDCKTGLRCYHRSGTPAVPPCRGGGAGDISSYDYCVPIR